MTFEPSKFAHVLCIKIYIHCMQLFMVGNLLASVLNLFAIRDVTSIANMLTFSAFSVYCYIFRIPHEA